MAYLNSDDLLLPGALSYVARFLHNHPEVDLVYGHRVLIDELGREIGRQVIPRHSDRVLSWADFIPQETAFWRRAAWDRAGGTIDESFRYAIDWDLWCACWKPARAWSAYPASWVRSEFTVLKRPAPWPQQWGSRKCNEFESAYTGARWSRTRCSGELGHI